MTISVGDKVPSVTMKHMGADGLEDLSSQDLFAGKKVVVFGLPGAFTPTCSAKHVPGYLNNAGALRAKGVDTIACVSVNDAFVMHAWGKDRGVGDNIEMVADGNCELTDALGLAIDLSAPGLGTRSKRYAMVVEDGVVKSLDVEDNPGEVTVSSAESVLAKL